MTKVERTPLEKAIDRVLELEGEVAAANRLREEAKRREERQTRRADLAELELEGSRREADRLTRRVEHVEGETRRHVWLERQALLFATSETLFPFLCAGSHDDAMREIIDQVGGAKWTAYKAAAESALTAGPETVLEMIGKIDL